MKPTIDIILSLFTLLATTHALPHPLSSLSSFVSVSIKGLNIRQDSIEAITDTILFTDTIEEFLAARAAQDPPQLNWVSNGCSFSPDKPLGYNFLPSCQRHDFGYHNYQAQDRFTDANRLRIDDNFKNDLYNQCETYDAASAETCKGLADVYYGAVRTFGGLTGIGDDG